MDDFIVSARKYRPETFSAVVGQQAITTTLKNSIRTNHLGHAYLFCGPRGVGKTTCARIFAKTINCMNLSAETEACNSCESCKSFNETRAFNIHELDAASNNSVDDIRNLTDQVRVPPQVGRYSIYIIDEVHMLSAQAFNAFLKTLEEPPAHAVFILATTEKHKIIPTILSRCQIFDFNRIKIQDIISYLKQIAEAEGVTCEEDALSMIAQKADGAMRDALSIFDQMVSFSGELIRYIDVINNLNILDYEYYFSLTQAILNNDVSKLLLIFDEILIKGFDTHNFLNGLSRHFRDLLVCKDPVTIELLETGDRIKERYKQQSAQCTIEFLFQALDDANQADIAFKTSNNQRLLIEMLLIRLSNIMVAKKKQQSDKAAPGIKEPAIEPSKEKPGPEGATSTKDGKSEKSGPGEPPHAAESDSVEPSIEGDKENAEPGEETGNREAVKRISATVSTQSIKDALNGNHARTPEQEADQEIDGIIKDTVFSSEQLNQKWLDFAESIKSDKPRMYSFLKNHLPELKEDYKLVVNFNNSAQLDMFNAEIKLDLKGFLTAELSNNIFSIVPHLPEKKDDTEQLYTQEAKYEHLKKKNPALEQLKKDFNLDFE